MSDTITITGNVATHPEHKRTSAGVPITTFRVASGLRRFDKAANAWVESGTNWYSVSAFRGLADHAFHSLRKGDRVLLTGRLRVRDWESGGKRGTSVDIDVDAIGHDLLWGTTTFVKDAAPSAADREPAWTAPGAPDDSWAPPGVDAEDARRSGAWGDADAENAERSDAEDSADAELRPLELSGVETPY